MNFADMVRARLASLRCEQRDLARAVNVTDSYISQLLTRRKAPPSIDRTDIYPRMESFLRLRPGELVRVVEIERAEEARRKLGKHPAPLFREFRDLVLRKCVAARREEVRAEFEDRPFGPLERLITRTLLEAVQKVARKKLESDHWLRLASPAGGRTLEEMRVMVLDFLDTDVLEVTKKNCITFLEPLVDSWDIEMATLRLDISFNAELVEDAQRTYSFQEWTPEENNGPNPGLEEFLEDSKLAGDITEDETAFLQSQRFDSLRPNKLYYYRCLQVLRDPLHFYEDIGDS